MMREKVCIVLNEREAAKHQAVANLSEQLEKHSITTSRLPVTEKIIENILTRNPTILVLDYLLGDFTTGLDILTAVQELPEQKRPRVFFLTDEPSPQVAVEALQRGARDYLMLDRKDSIPRLVSSIAACLSQEKKTLRPDLPRPPGLDDLVWESPAAKRVLEQVITLQKKQTKIIFIYGEPGCGISSLAEAIQLSRSDFYEYCDLTFCTIGPRQILGFPAGPAALLQAGTEKGLLLEHAEHDDGTLLDHCARYLPQIYNYKEALKPTIVTSTDPSCLKAWNKALKPDIISIPPLRERKEDIHPLLQRFMFLAEGIIKPKTRALPVAVTEDITAMDWPGNLKQLKSVILDSVIEAEHSSEDLREIIDRKRVDWIRYNQMLSELPDKLTAARALNISGHNYRLAARRLGCSPFELTKVLNET